MDKWGLEYWHPHFGWMRWEPGDKYGSKDWAEYQAKLERARGARVRVVQADAHAAGADGGNQPKEMRR